MTTTLITTFFPTRRRSASISGAIRRRKIPPPSVVFDKAGLVTLRCDIHEHMRGLILVLETPYFAITDAQGHFRLTNLPAGRHLAQSLDRQQNDAGTSGRFAAGCGVARGPAVNPATTHRTPGIRRFRTRLLIAMMLVVSVLTLLGIFLAQRRAADDARADLQRDFELELASLHRLQDLRNAAVADRSNSLAQNARIHAALGRQRARPSLPQRAGRIARSDGTSRSRGRPMRPIHCTPGSTAFSTATAPFSLHQTVRQANSRLTNEARLAQGRLPQTMQTGYLDADR